MLNFHDVYLSKSILFKWFHLSPTKWQKSLKGVDVQILEGSNTTFFEVLQNVIKILRLQSLQSQIEMINLQSLLIYINSKYIHSK